MSSQGHRYWWWVGWNLEDPLWNHNCIFRVKSPEQIMKMSPGMWPTDDYIRLCSVSIGTVGNAMIAKPTKIQAKKFTFSIYGQPNQFPCIAGFLLENIHYAIRSNSSPIASSHFTPVHSAQMIDLFMLLTIVNLTTKFCLFTIDQCQTEHIWSLHVTTLSGSCNKNRLFFIITHWETEHAPDLFMFLCVNLVMKTVSPHHYPMPMRASIWEQH